MKLIANLNNCKISVISGNVLWDVPRDREKEVKEQIKNEDYSTIIKEIIDNGSISINKIFNDSEEIKQPEIIIKKK